MSEKKMLSVKEAADYLGVSPNTIRNYMARKILPWNRTGPKLIKFDPADLDSFKQRHVVRYS
jgi:excisionase family DNA binding protein